MAGETLRTISGNSPGREIPLSSDFVVGRSGAGMDDLGGDLEISRQHARFRRTERGRVIVEDLGSTNGTLVNGRRISAPQLLEDGDQITLGKTVLRYDAGERPTDVHAVAAAPAERATDAHPVQPAPPGPLAPAPVLATAGGPAAAAPVATQPSRLLLPLALGAVVAIGLYVWAKNLTPDYGTSLFGQTAGDTLPLKSWLATALLALAVLQVITALWLYGKLLRSRPRRLGVVHRLTGAAAILVSLPIAYHCMFAYGFRSFDTRTAVHSVAGCFFYGAIVAKITIVRTKRLPGWALPLAGGTVVTLVFVLWYSAALWYFNDSSVPLLTSSSTSSGSSSSSAPTYSTTPSAAPAPAPNAPSGGGTTAVAMKNIQFAPRDVTVKVGDTVKWTNQDSVAHNVTATGGASFKSSNFGKGGTYTYRAAAPGKISYVCTIHPGMDGTLTVR
jgi:plastocyanin